LLRQFPWISESKTTKLEYSKVVPFSHNLLLARVTGNGTRLLTCYELSQKIEEVWELKIPAEVDAIDDVQLSLDGERVVVVGARQLSVKPMVWVCDRESSTWLQYMIDHSVYLSPDLKTAAFVRWEGDKEETYTTRILALDSRRGYRTYSDMVEPLYVFTPDGQAYARATDKLTVETVESAERRLEYQLSKAESVCFDAEGKLLAVGATGVIAVIDLKSKLPIAEYRVASRITRLAFTKDDRYLISHHANATALVWPVRKPRYDSS
jgi:hypothetical protein